MRYGFDDFLFCSFHNHTVNHILSFRNLWNEVDVEFFYAPWLEVIMQHVSGAKIGRTPFLCKHGKAGNVRVKKKVVMFCESLTLYIEILVIGPFECWFLFLRLFVAFIVAYLKFRLWSRLRTWVNRFIIIRLWVAHTRAKRTTTTTGKINYYWGASPVRGRPSGPICGRRAWPAPIWDSGGRASGRSWSWPWWWLIIFYILTLEVLDRVVINNDKPLKLQFLAHTAEDSTKVYVPTRHHHRATFPCKRPACACFDRVGR